MKRLPVLFATLFCTVSLAAQGPAVESLDDASHGSPNAFGGTLEFPVFAIYQAGGPRFDLPGVPEGAEYQSGQMEQVVGIGFVGVWQHHLTDDGRLQTAVTLGFRRQLGSAIFQWIMPHPGTYELPAPGWMDFSINSLRAGGEIQVQPLRWGEETELRESGRSGEGYVRATTGGYGILLRGGASGVWRTGSELTMMTHPDNVGGGTQQGYVHEPEPHVYYDGPIPELEPFGLELLGGVAFEFPISNRVIGSLSVMLTESITPVAADEWGYRVIGVEGSVVW